MKILLTGGGTGGHFYPIIAVAEGIADLVKENRLVNVELFYMSDTPYNEGLLYEHGITFIQNRAGKLRVSPSFISFLKNVLDVFIMGWGTISACIKIFKLYPDVIFAKGGYASFPALFAAKIFRIPVVLHESDSVPGRVTKWAGKFATRVAISYPESAQYFPKEKVANTGNPLRREIMMPANSGAFEFLDLEANVPVILILGGSQGAQIINEVILNSLTDLVKDFQIIHQTGKNNFDFATSAAQVILKGNAHSARYKPFDYLNLLSMRMSAGACDIVISRAGSTIFEIASWGKPSIIIPITTTNGDHQRKNAYEYARSGAADVIEEKNLNAHILLAEIRRILGDSQIKNKMISATKTFFKSDAAKVIANEILKLGIEHEK